MKADVFFWFLQSAIIFRLTYSEVIKANKSLLRTVEGFGYAYFIFHPNSSLEVAEIKRQFHAQSYKHCIVACASDTTCLSLNFGKQPLFFYQGKAQYLCELLPTDKYNSSSNYTSENPNFNHYSIRTNCSKSPCLHNSTCIPNYKEDTYECLCLRPPYEGKECRDVNECTTGQHDCSPNATCNNTIGSYVCKCKAGFGGNGKTCEKQFAITLESAILSEYGNKSYEIALKSFMDQVQQDIVSVSWIRCWSGIQDGFDVTTTFHPQCDHKKPTITLVRKGQYILGGYTDIPWSTENGFKTSDKSFMFSLYNMHGFNPMKFNILPTKTNTAVYHHSLMGPVFGGGYDFSINNGEAEHDCIDSYDTPPGCSINYECDFYTGKEVYTIDDVEVFYKDSV